MLKSIFFFIYIILCINYNCRSQDLQAFNNIFQSYLDSGFSGVVLLIKDDKIILNKGYGYANEQGKTLNNAKTLFNVASIGKQFTAIAILQLEEKGLLRTTDFASKHLGSMGPVKDSATIHHLLSHTSGLFVEGTQLDYSSRENFVASVKNTPLESRPGEKHRYSNAGYTLLAAIVEVVSKMPFEDYLLRHIFRPAGMLNTGYPWEKRIDKSLLATGYNGKGEPLPVQNNVWGIRGPGHLVINAEDMHKWYRAYLKDKVIAPGIREKMFFNYLPGFETYSWNKTTTVKGERVFHKGGGRPDFESQTMWFPDHKLFIFFSINRDKNIRRLIFRDINTYMNKL